MLINSIEGLSDQENEVDRVLGSFTEDDNWFIAVRAKSEPSPCQLIVLPLHQPIVWFSFALFDKGQWAFTCSASVEYSDGGADRWSSRGTFPEYL